MSDYPHNSDSFTEPQPRPCFVYFIAAGSTPIKIGVSDNPADRLSALQTAHYQQLRLLYTIECSSRQAAYALESAFHRWYGEAQIRNEWFKLTPAQIADDVGLLLSLSKDVVDARQHITPSEIASLEVKAERKLNHHSKGTGELANTVVENTDGSYSARCPQCAQVFSSETYRGAINGLVAHTRHQHRKSVES